MFRVIVTQKQGGINMNEMNQQYGSQPPIPSNYLVFAILTTICCCWPLGIPAIVFAAQVNSKYEAGDYLGAEKASSNAKLWTLLALGGGVLLYLLSIAYYVFVFVIMAASAAGAQNGGM